MKGVSSDVCLSTKNVGEHVAESENVIDKVHFILRFLDIPISYDSELIDLCNTISDFSASLKITRIRNSNIDDSLNRISFRSKEIK